MIFKMNINILLLLTDIESVAVKYLFEQIEAESKKSVLRDLDFLLIVDIFR